MDPNVSERYKDITATWFEKWIMGSPCSMVTLLFIGAMLFFTFIAFWPKGMFPFKNFRSLLTRAMDNNKETQDADD